MTDFDKPSVNIDILLASQEYLFYDNMRSLKTLIYAKGGYLYLQDSYIFPNLVVTGKKTKGIIVRYIGRLDLDTFMVFDTKDKNPVPFSSFFDRVGGLIDWHDFAYLIKKFEKGKNANGKH